MVSLFKKLFTASPTPARELYRAVVAQSRQSAFFTECGVPDTPNGRFEVLALHLFLVMHRLRGEDGLADLARALSEEAIQDIDRNLREMGVGDLSVGRKVKSLAEGLYGRFGAYTDGLNGSDAELAEALKRNLFSEAGAEGGAIVDLVDYLKRETQSLRAAATADLRNGRLGFGKAPGAREDRK